MNTEFWWENFLENVHLNKCTKDIGGGRQGNIKADLKEVDCEHWRWTELVQDRVQWWALVLTALNLGVLIQRG